MKICVIGTSHVGSLKRGWANINRNFPGKEVTFFADRGPGLDRLGVCNGVLSPSTAEMARSLEVTSGGKKNIDPAEYDIILIYGAVIDNIGSDNDTQFYSKAVIESILVDSITPTTGFRILKKLRAVTNKIVLVGHAPLPAATKIVSDDFPSNYIDRIERINNLIYRPLNSKLIMQPVSTIVKGNNTHPALSKGSKQLAVGDSYDDWYHPDGDIIHMNARFGEIWLTEFLNNYAKEADPK